MTDEKICPFMSRPHRPTNEILTSEDWSRIEEIGPNGIYLDGVVPAPRTKDLVWGLYGRQIPRVREFWK